MQSVVNKTQQKMKTQTEIAAQYGVTQKTFRKMIEPIRDFLHLPPNCKVLNPRQQKIIYDYLGEV